MNKLVLIALSLVLFFGIAPGVANAKNRAAVNKSDQVKIVNALEVDAAGKLLVDKDDIRTRWQDILPPTLIDAEDGKDKAFLIDVSAVTGIFTANVSIYNNNTVGAVFDKARLQVRVLVDGVEATPGPVTFDALLRFHFAAGSTAFINVDLSARLAAHAFNFYKVGIKDTPGDDHIIRVQARVCLDADTFSRSGLVITDVATIIGKRTVTVETATIDLDEDAPGKKID
jgi:hypothetical protein